MLTVIQILIDVAAVLWLILLTAAHFSGRSTSAELDIFRDVVERWMEGIEAKLSRKQ